jgi:hypothetical protein
MGVYSELAFTLSHPFLGRPGYRLVGVACLGCLGCCLDWATRPDGMPV